MIAVIKGDIIHSRELKNQDKWLLPLKQYLSKWGTSPQKWEIVWGDFFQLEIDNPMEALSAAIEIKALIKSVEPEIMSSKMLSTIDVRMAIGIGQKEYAGKSISENNGEAYIFSSEKFERLKNEKSTLAIQTLSNDFNEEMNLYLRLATRFMDNWSVNSGKIVQVFFKNRNLTQNEIGVELGIKQNSVSGRFNRANVQEVLDLDNMFRKKLKKLME